MGKKEKEPKKKKKVWLIVLLSILGAIIFIVGGLFIANSIASKTLIDYIHTFEAVEYDATRLLPEKQDYGDNKFYTFTTAEGNDLKVMQLTDLHIGGGIFTTKQDRKVIYETISMLRAEKPDLVILTGDNIFAVPGPIFNGGGTLNNKMVSKVVLEIFEHEKVYFSTVFGNHDTEVFDYTSRQNLAKLYMEEKYEYCIFNQDFTDSNAKMPSVTNQCIVVKNHEGAITKALMLLDSNAYVDNSIKSVLDWKYDVIHSAQVDWAKETLQDLSTIKGSTVESLFFFHIPTPEFQTAYEQLKANNFEDTANAKYVSGYWDEKVDEDLGGRIWYGGCGNDSMPQDYKSLFDELKTQEFDSLRGIFVGHDHTNNAVVEYNGVILSYGNSMDNIAYDNICKNGKQRGCTIITIDDDGTWSEEHKNAYLPEYNIDKNKFYPVDTENFYYPNVEPATQD